MNKTRFAAWVMFATALVLTLAAMWFGIEMLSALTAILTAIWTAAIGLLGFAYRDMVGGGN